MITGYLKLNLHLKCVKIDEKQYLFYHPLNQNNLIFFMFIRFPAILLVKTIDSYLHEYCARGIFYIAIFNNMAQRQRARYRVARYVIVNNVTTASLESKTKNA